MNSQSTKTPTMDNTSAFITPSSPLLSIDNSISPSSVDLSNHHYVIRDDSLPPKGSENNTESSKVHSKLPEVGFTLADVPLNQIPPNPTNITPDMLPLIDLTQQDIDIIASQVDGGIANIKDIYALSPVQDGFLLEHIKNPNSDPYVTTTRLYFDNKDLLDRYLDAFRNVIKRNDMFRSVIIWDGITTAAQVVLRSAILPVIELSLSPENGPIADQMSILNDPRGYKMNLTKAPLVHFVIAQDVDGRWVVDELVHHISSDGASIELYRNETHAFMNGMDDKLPMPQQFRNRIAQLRSGISNEDHKKFFTNMLAGVESPAIPYGMSNTFSNTPHGTNEAFLMISSSLDKRLREQSKLTGISTSRICHVAWAQVMSRISGQEHVVFGTVISGRSRSLVASQALGPFINTLPIRVDTDVSLLESLNRVRKDISSVLKHENASLALAQSCRSITDRNPIFYSALTFRKGVEKAADIFENSGISFHPPLVNFTPIPITMSIDHGASTLGLTAMVPKPRNALWICEYMKQALESIVDALEYNPNILVRDLEVIPVEERDTLIRIWNDTTADLPNNVCIHQQFEYYAMHSPNSTALFFEGQSMTYRQLNDRANHLAHHLINLGVKPNSLVAICVNRSFAMIIGLLAVLKAGGAYVPLDPSFASERLHNILSDASPSILLADNSGMKALQSPILQSINVVDPNIIFNTSSRNPQIQNLSPHDLAYVIYTSGSTGNPKGVMIEHQSVSNLALTRPKVFGVDSSSRVLQFFSISFDGSVHEIVSALCNGGSLHLTTDETRMDRSKLWDYLRAHSITHATLTPALIQDCTDMPKLDTPLAIVLAGEALSPALLRDLQTLIPNGTIINDYGPTETTVDAIGWRSPKNFNGQVVPIGRPHANKRVYVLNEHQMLVPTGVIGELYIAGVGVARGYLNQPELTRKSFFIDPFSHGSINSRMYKTGDLVRYLPDGNLEFLGRSDHQVKIRGYRIELGEIETRLLEHQAVKESVVIARGEGDKRHLIAYFVAEGKVSPDALPSLLRAHLSAKLPDYMVPSAFVSLDEFPLTLNGKINLQALPDPERNDVASQKYELPQGDIEIALANIWELALKVDKVGRNDNFFMLGGHSLLAVRMLKEIKNTLGHEVKLQTLFDSPTIAELAPHFQQKEVKKDPMFNVLFPLKTKGNRLPLFCVHSAVGLAWSYQRLTKHFHPDQPIYGLQARGMDGIEDRASTMEEMTDDYINQIRSVQPRGPYHLLGWSFGGNIAQNIATQLRKRGEPVAILALMDSTLDYDTIAENINAEVEHIFITSFKDLASGPDWEEEGKVLWEKAQLSIKNHLQIAKNFSTMKYPGDMIYFSATKNVPFTEPTTTWAPFTLGRIEVYDVECKHIEMDHVEHIAVVGDVLEKKLGELHKSRRLSKL